MGPIIIFSTLWQADKVLSETMVEHGPGINYSVQRNILNYWVETCILQIILFLYYVHLSIYYWFLPKVCNSNQLYVYTYTREYSPS